MQGAALGSLSIKLTWKEQASLPAQVLTGRVYTFVAASRSVEQSTVWIQACKAPDQFRLLGPPHEFLGLPRTSNDFLGPKFPYKKPRKNPEIQGNPSNSYQFQGLNSALTGGT